MRKACKHAMGFPVEPTVAETRSPPQDGTMEETIPAPAPGQPETIVTT
jgi:hypothetical protein